jgi:hypothetical protein
MASLARRGSCIAFQTPIGIERDLAEKSLAYVPLTDKRLPSDRLMVVRRQGHKARLATDAFLELAEARLVAIRNVRK